MMMNHDPRMMREELERVREWAIEQLAAGNEPPWSWYQYMKLREAAESILAGMDVTQPRAIFTGIGTTLERFSPTAGRS